MSNLLGLVLIFFAAAMIYRFRSRVLGALRRFDERNAWRRAEELSAMGDSLAHYRQTVQFAEEQIEPVARIVVADERTGQPVARYLFLGSQYASRKEAEAARYAVIVEKAREFYSDLDRIYLSRNRRPSPPGSFPALTDPSKHETYTPPRP